MASNDKNYYVSSPIGSDYEGVNNEVISRGVDFSKRTHRLLSGFGDNENRYDGGSTSFKYLEGTLFSTKDVKFLDSDPSMLETGFIKSAKDKEGCIYNVLRFDREHNIRTFEFIITYTQLSDWGAKTYKPVPVTRQFRGSFLFTGCSIIRDTNTMEELPLKLYAKYESIGDTIGECVDIDGKLDTKGGPALTFTYTYDNDYVYLYISSISPFRLIPSGDGEFKDVSYLDDTGVFVGEDKPTVQVIKDPATGLKKTEVFSRNKTIWCDVNISLKDTTVCHTNGDCHPVNYDPKLEGSNYKSKETSFTLVPTNDGEQMVIGMTPDSDVSLELAQDTKPVRFGSRLLKTDMDKVEDYIQKLSERIKTASTNIEQVPFIIKTSIRTRGKYNIRGEYFIDDKADSFGQILIQDVGVYNVITDSFEITEYITDKKTLVPYKASTVDGYRKYIKNASEYLSEISGGVVYPHVRKTNKLLDILSNIQFEEDNSLDVYSDIAYIRSPVTFEAVAAYAEFGDDDTVNEDDKVIYICKDGKIRVCGFKDYEMVDAEVYDIFGKFLPTEIIGKTYVTKVDRAWNGDHYTYCFGTNNGIYAIVEGIAEGEIGVEIKDAFIDGTNEGEFSTGEEVVYLKCDNEYFYIGGKDGSIRIINVDNLDSNIPTLHFQYNDSIKYAELISDDTVLFISELEACTYNLSSKKWNFEGDDYRLNAKFWNPFGNMKYPNKDLIICKDGWENVPTIQIGQYLFAMGMRKDTSGYVPVYKRLDTITGEVIDLPLPDKEFRTYRPQLCKEENLIYVVGGSKPGYDPTSPDELSTFVSVFDTASNKWTGDYISYFLTKDDENRSLYSPNFHPAVIDGKIYIVKPRVSYFVKNAITEIYSSVDTYDEGMYVLDTNEALFEYVELSGLPQQIVEQKSVNVVPAMVTGSKIVFLAGLKNVTYDNASDVYTFNGYDLYRITLDTKDNSITYTTELANSNELAANYAGNKANTARTDLFSIFSINSENNEAIVYCLDCYAIIYLRLDVPYSQVHLVYHTLSNATYKPLVSEGEYSAWCNYNKMPGAVSLVHIGNYLAFVGGTASRVDGYLSLDTISWIPSPRYTPRSVGTNNETAVLNNKSDAISIISTEKNIFNQVSGCRIGQTQYLLGVKKNSTEYETVLYKYELDDPTAKIEFVKSLDMISPKYPEGFTNWTLTPLGDNHILFVPAIGYANGMYDKCTEFNVFAYNIAEREIDRIVTDTAVGSLLYKNTYALEGENKVIYTAKESSSLVVELLNGNIHIDNVIDNFFGDLQVPYTEKEQDCIIPSVRRGKFALCAEAYEETIVIHKFDTIDGSESVSKDSFLYTIDNSVGYKNPQLFINGDDLYLTKGYKDSAVSTNGVNTVNKAFSIEVFKLKFSEAAGIKTGTDNDRMHAILSANTSNMYAPFAISRSGNITIFGEVRVDLNSEEKNNVNVKLIPLESTITEETFVDVGTHVTLTGASKSATNRYAPVMKTMHADGHELVLVFGGHASPETEITKTLDVYDTARHIWSNICDLPDYISHVSTKENVILGGTSEIIKDGTQKAFSKRLEIICKNYDTLDFDIVEKQRPDYDYPVYASWCEEGEHTYVVPTTADGHLKKENVIKIVGDVVSTIEPIDSPTIYNNNYKLIGTTVIDSNLIIVLFNNMTFEISFWKNVNNAWSKVTYITEPNGIDITKKAWVFDSNFEDYKAITNGKVYSAKAVLAYVDPSEVNSKGVLVSYLRINETGNIEVSDPETFAFIPGDDLSHVDSVEISKDGFTYYSKNNSSNGEVRRIFPNNNTLGFGCRRCEATDMSDKPVKTRAIYNNDIYTIYEDNTMSKINLYTDNKEDLEGSTVVEGNILHSKIIDGCVYVVTDTKKLYKIPLTDISNTESYVLDSDVNMYEYPHIIRDIEENTFTLVYGYDESVDGEYTVYYAEFDTKDTVNNWIKLFNRTSTALYGKDCIFIDENLDVVYKEDNSDKLYVSSFDGSKKNVTSIPSDIKLCTFDYGTVYGVDFSGKVYEIVVKDYEFKRAGYTYMTTVFNREIPKDAIIRNSDIVLFDRGYRYINPTTIDFNHYCYDNIAIDHDINTSFEDKVVSIGVSTDNADAFLVYTSEKATHLVETRKTVVDNKGKFISNIVIGETSTIFVDKISDVIHLYIADPISGKLYNIDTYTGITVITNIDDLKGSGKINAIKKHSEKNTYLLHLSGNLVSYNTKTNEYTSKEFITKLGAVKHIIKVDPYNKNVRVLMCKEGDEYYMFGIFNGPTLELKNCSETNIRTIYNKIETNDGSVVILSNDKGNAVEIDISDNEAYANAVRFIPDYFKDVDTVSDKPLITFHGNIVAGNDLDGYKFKFDDVLFNDNSYVINGSTVTDIKFGKIFNVLKYKEFFIVLSNDEESENPTRLTLVDAVSGNYKDISASTDELRLFNSTRNIAVVNTEKYYDTLNSVCFYGQILSINNNDDVKLIFIKSDNNVSLNLNDDTLGLQVTDITEIVEKYNVDLTGYAISTNSNTVTFLPRNGSDDSAVFVMSETYGSPSIITEDNISVNDTTVVFVVADTTFVVDKTTWYAGVIYSGVNGERKTVSGPNKILSISLSNKERESIKRIAPGVYYAKNDRIGKVGKEDLYFNPVRAISEFYSRYIGVSSVGEIYDAKNPISEFEISTVAISDLTSDSDLMRAEGNIVATPYIVYKSADENVVAHLPIVTRLNTAKFVKDYDKTDDLSTGEIYAFLPSSLNGTLIRDDTSYYRGEYAVSIINSSIVKIKVDDEVLTFSNTDGEFPFKDNILPIVMSYGTRTGTDGLSEYRYYSFIDIRGNVSTFDKELRSFVDIDGNVSVEVPFFSATVQILPSTVTKRNDVGAEVWAYSENNPYLDTDKDDSFITDFVKKNQNLLN